MIKKLTKYLFYAVALFSVAVLILILILQTTWFTDIVRKSVVNQVNKEINAYFSIGAIDGNWFYSLQLKDVELRDKTDSSLIIALPSIALEYNLEALLRKKIDVHLIEINSPEVWLKQSNSGEWNLTQVFENKKDSIPKSDVTFPFRIDISNINLSGADIHAQSKTDLLPDSLINLTLKASFQFQKDFLRTRLNHLELSSYSPNLTIKEVKAIFETQHQKLNLDSLYIVTDRSLFNADAIYESLANNKIKLDASPLDRNEFTLFIPQIEIPNSPSINLNFDAQSDTAHININLKVNNESISVAGQLINLQQMQAGSASEVPFNITVNLANVVPENWWHMTTTNSIVNGQLQFKGKNLLDYKSWTHLEGDLSNSVYKHHHFNTFQINARQIKDTLIAGINGRSAIGHLNGLAIITNPFHSPAYKIDMQIDSLLLNEVLTSNAGYVNGLIKLSGAGFNPDSIDLAGSLYLFRSNLYDIPVDSASLTGRFRNNQIDISESNISLPGAIFNIQGHYELPNNKLKAFSDFSIDTLSFLKAYKLPHIGFQKATGKVDITGNIDSLVSRNSIRLNNFNGFELLIDSVQSESDVTYINKQFGGKGNFDIHKLTTGNLIIDSITSTLSYDKQLIIANAQVKMDSIQADLKSEVFLADTISLNLSRLNIKTPFASYYLPDSSNVIQVFNNNLMVKNLTIKDHVSPGFSIFGDGTISATETENFKLSINEFNLHILNELNLIEKTINGLLNSQVHLEGKPDDPVLKSSFNISPGQFGNIQTPELNGFINVDSSFFKSKVFMAQEKENINLSFTTPFSIILDTLGYRIEPDSIFEAHLVIDSMEIAKPTSKLVNVEANGGLSANIITKGTYKYPLFYGSFNIEKGRYKDLNYGVDIQDANIKLSFDSNMVSIDKFLLKRDKGFMTLSGQATFDSSLVTGRIHSSTLEADADKFYIINHRDYSALIDAKTFFKNIDEKNQFGGKITVQRSDFYIPAFTGTTNESELNAAPLLVEALQSNDSIAAGTEELKRKLQDKQQNSKFIKNLKGRLQLYIPRNTWLRGDEMKIEIWGDLEIEKSNDYFELFGDVGINRGHYILYGKKFVIEEGQLSFQGGEKIDPILDFNASYTYRGADKVKRYLKLNVTNKLSEPTITFTLDGTAIPEADAVSILVFGKTMDELSFDGQNGIAGSIGTNMLAQAITSQLSKTLGTRFNLDMIEVTATENWQSAAFVVGKYVTNDLFVIYQRGFGETEGDEITPEMIILEYELNRILFFRLQSGSSKESGFDVILKFESKKE